MANKKGRRVYFEHESDYIDTETGEKKGSRSVKSSVVYGEPDFVKLYVEDMLMLMRLSPSHLKLVMWLSRRLTYADDEVGLCVSLSTALKKLCVEQIGMASVAVLDNALWALNKAGVIKRLGVGLYQLNPYFVGKGNWADVSRIRVTIDYDSLGRRIDSYYEADRQRSHAKKVDFVGENSPKVEEGVSDKPVASDAERLRVMLADRLGVPVSAVKIGEDEEENPVGKVVVHEEGEDVA